MSDTLNVSVIGAGTMGNGIAQVFADFGHNVILIDLSQDSLDRGVAAISKSLARFVKKEKKTQGEVDQILARIGTATDTAAGVASADLVVEAVFENEQVKMDIFRTLDEAAPAHAATVQAAAVKVAVVLCLR